MSDKKTMREMIEADQYLRAEENMRHRIEIQEMVDSAVVQPIDVEGSFDDIVADNEAMTRALPFIDQRCPFRISDRDVVMINASSGTGKSTLAGEITASYLHHNKPILYLSNEESTSEVLRRIAYFVNGWNPKVDYASQNQEQAEKLKNTLIYLKTKVFVVAKDSVEIAAFVPTQTAEGLHRILDGATDKYCAVIIDYYQAIDTTVRNPKALPHEAQLIFDRRLDYYRTHIKCPIFIFSQSKPMQAGSIRADFQNNRQKGNTKVFDKTTVVAEIQTMHRKKSKNSEGTELRMEMQNELDPEGSPSITVFYLHKDRFRGMTRNAMLFQFVKGRYKFLRMLDKEQMEILES